MIFLSIQHYFSQEWMKKCKQTQTVELSSVFLTAGYLDCGGDENQNIKATPNDLHFLSQRGIHTQSFSKTINEEHYLSTKLLTKDLFGFTRKLND